VILKSKHIMLVIALMTLCGVANTAHAQGLGQGIPTKVMVRAVSRDAKVIGTRVGGARITIRDVSNGIILAEGIQKGETGSTDQIMVHPRKRGAAIFDTPGTAGLLTTVMLRRPTIVEVAAEGPLGTPQSKQRVSKTLLLVPGQDVLGDGIVLEIHGFTVTLLTPNAEDTRLSVGKPLEVRAGVTLTCGCPTEPGGIWNADKIKVIARIVRDGKVVGEVPLKYAGVSSTYTGQLILKDTGPTVLEVLAMDAANANFGLISRDVTVVR